MGEFIKTGDLIQTVTNLHDSILESQYSRFLQQSPTITTYFRINANASTVDLGTMNIERPIGDNSPLRFNKVTNFPMYGLEEAAFSLDDDAEGLDMNFSSSAIIIPNTLDPYPGDYFTTETLGPNFVFQVVNVRPDTVRSNPFKMVEYKLSSIDREGTIFKQLEAQSVESFTTEISNIGTDDMVFIKSEEISMRERLASVKKDIVEYYKMIFYDGKYNSFLFNDINGTRLYDRALTKFITDSRVFSTKNSYETLMLTIEDKAKHSELEFHNSIYRAVLKKDPSLIKHNKFVKNFIGDGSSIFVRWSDESIRSADQGRLNGKSYIDPEVLDFWIDANIYFPLNDDNSSNESNGDDGLVDHIILPDENGKPVYVPDADITKKFTEDTTVEQAIKIPRGECAPCEEKENNHVTEDGSLNLGALFFDPPEEDEVVECIHDNTEHNNGDTVPVTIIDNSQVHVSFELDKPDDIMIITEESKVAKISEQVKARVTESKKVYLEPTEIDKFNIMVKTIAMYFSERGVSYNNIDLEALEDYLDYMDMYNFQTFVLVPILLFVLNSIDKA